MKVLVKNLVSVDVVDAAVRGFEKRGFSILFFIARREKIPLIAPCRRIIRARAQRHLLLNHRSDSVDRDDQNNNNNRRRRIAEGYN